MAFVTIDASRYQVGKATRKELFEDLVGNTDDLDSRMTNVEAAATKIVVYEGDVFNIYSTPFLDHVATFQAKSDFTLNDAVIGVYDISGTVTGTLSANVKKASTRDFSAASSVFTTQPSLNLATCGDYATSTNAVFDSGQSDVTTGDYLQIAIDSIGTEEMERVYIKLLGVPS